jgi:hypothetical protein
MERVLIMDNVKSTLLSPDKLWSRSEILTSQSPVPKSAGIYAWYFKQIPPTISIDDCHSISDLALMYVGISPKANPLNGAPPSKQNLHKRIRYHMQGNAEGSTLRLTLGCLLSDRLGIQLRRVGSGSRKTFSDGEHVLSKWMTENAFVAWAECDEPWKHEEQIIPELSLPLNLQHNNDHPFYSHLKAIRRESKQLADSLPIIPR